MWFQGRRAEKVLWAVAALSAVFIAAEFTGGFFASSLAIMTDAGHMLSDLLSFIISIVAIRTARHPRSCFFSTRKKTRLKLGRSEEAVEKERVSRKSV